jgi:CheY-like chemotaxis protein
MKTTLMNAVESLPHVLIVDDDRFVRESIVDSLEVHHIAVTPAANLPEAREKLAAGVFDAVVLDWMMPDRAGPILLDHLAKSSPHIRRIVFSAHDTIDGEATARGADAFVSKGAPPDALRLAIERLLRSDRPLPPPAMPLPKSLAAAARRLARWVDRPVVGIVVPDGWLADDVTVAMTQHFTAGSETRLIEPAEGRDADACRADLFGRVDTLPEFRITHGRLECSKPTVAIVMQADEMPIIGEVTQAAIDRTIRRIGRKDPIATTLRVVLMVDMNRKRLLPRSVHQAVDDSWLTLPAELDASDELPGWIEALSDGRRSLGMGSLIAIKKLKAKIPLSGLDPIRAAVRSSRQPILEMEDLGLPLLEDFGNSEKLRTYRETSERTDVAYLCRVMAVSKGNVEDASRQAGLTRQYTYQLLKKYDIQPSDFREPPFISDASK